MTDKTNRTTAEPWTSRIQESEIDERFWNEKIVLGYITIVLSALSVYLAVSQIAYFYLAHIKRKERSKNHDHVISLNSLCASAAFATFLRVGIPLERIVGGNTDEKCIAVIEYRIITFGLSFSMLYTILWLKQRTFYWSPALEGLTAPAVRYASIITPMIIWPGCVVTIVLVNLSERYYASKYGCAIERLPLNTFGWIYRGVMFLLMQCNLLALFTYPLYKHRIIMKNRTARNTSSIDNLIKRTVLTTLVCVVMDSICTLVGIFVQRELAVLPHFVYDINLLVDNIAVIVSFTNYSERFYPWKQLRIKADDGTVTNSNSNVSVGTASVS